MQGRTRWFPVGIKPAREGFYECIIRVPGMPFFVIWGNKLYWDGVGFLVPIPMMVRQWRGQTRAEYVRTKEPK